MSPRKMSNTNDDFPLSIDTVEEFCCGSSYRTVISLLDDEGRNRPKSRKRNRTTTVVYHESLKQGSYN